MNFRFFVARRACWLGWLLFVLSGEAAAWNGGGHRLTAVIAWGEMSAGARDQAMALLDQHAARADWENRIKRGKAKLAVTPLALFAEASTWADDIRHAARHAPAAATSGVNKDWHYVNWPIDRGPAGHRGGVLDREIKHQAGLLADPGRPANERALALVWLLHLVADAHQPLHVASWPLADGSFDDGGLRFNVRDESRSQASETSLHAWWDELAAAPWLRGERLRQRAEEMGRAYPAATIVQGTSDDWLDESFAIARASVRPPAADHDPWLLTDEYRTQAKKIGQRRLAEAGVRLGRLLDRLLTPAGRNQDFAGSARKR